MLTRKDFLKEYEDFLADIERMRNESEGYAFDSSELTKEEQAVIEALPDEVHEKIDEVLGRYAVQSFDMRRELMYKFVARQILKVTPIAEKAMQRGFEFGAKT